MTTITIPDEAITAAVDVVDDEYGYPGGGDAPLYRIIAAALDAGLEDAIRKDERAKFLEEMIHEAKMDLGEAVDNDFPVGILITGSHLEKLLLKLKGESEAER